MAERGLTITIDVDAGAAKAELQAVDRGVDKIAGTAKSTGSALSAYDQQVQAVVKSKQALTNTSAAAVDALNATRDAVQQSTSWYQQLNDAVLKGHDVNSVAIQDQKELFDWVNRGGQGWHGYAETARDAWAALRSFNVSDIRTALNGLAEGAGLTYANLGLMGSAGATLGAGYAGWHVGRMIADFFDLDKKIGNATASLLGWGDVAGQSAGAKADVLALATKRAGREITDFTEALKINTEWVQTNNVRARELNDVLARLDAPRQFTEQIASWRAEIGLLQDAGVLGSLKSALDSNLMSVKELADSYKVSVGAVQMYKNELKDEADAHRRSEAEAAKHRAEQERLQAQFDKTAAALARWDANVLADAMNMDRLLMHLKGLGVALPKINDLLAKHVSMQGELMPDMGTGGFGIEGNVTGSGDTGQGFLGDTIDKFKKSFDPKAIFNSMIGNGLSGLVSGGLSLVTQGIGSLFSKLFGNPEKEINPVREAYVQAAGGLAQLNEKAFAATGSLTLVQNLLAAKNADQYKVAIDALNTALDTQKAKVDADNTALGLLLQQGIELGGKLPDALKDSIQKLIDMGKVTGDTADIFKRLTGDTGVDFHKMEDIAKKYGLSLESLGPSFQSAKLNDTAASVINDFDTLTRGGADVGAVLSGMRKPINDIVNDSLQFGIAIPANMQPWINELFNTGQLIDGDGNKLTTLGNLKFADPIKTEFQKVIDKLQELIDKISGNAGLTKAITDIPDRTIHVGWNVDPAPDFGFRGEMSERMHAGGVVERYHRGGVILPFVARAHAGLAIDEVPIIAQRGEGILNRVAMKRMGGPNALNALNAGGGGSGLSVNVNIDQVKTELDERTAGDQIGRAVVNEMRRKGVRFSNR